MALCWHTLPTDPVDTKPYITWGPEETCPVCHPDLYEPYGKPSEAVLPQFTSSFARDIEMIRRGAAVTKTVAEHKIENNIPLAKGDETRPYAIALPEGKPIPTPAATRRNLQWARFTRFLRRVVAAFINFIASIKVSWKAW